MAQDLVYFGSFDGFLYAVDVVTGQLECKFDAEDWIVSSPETYGRYVFFGGRDRNLYDLDAKTEMRIWKFPTTDEVFASPAAEDGVVYFGSNDRNLYAVEIQTGTEIWKFKTQSRVWSTPAIHGGVIYFGDADRNLYALLTQPGTNAEFIRTILSNSETAMFRGNQRRSGVFETVGLEQLGGLKWRFTTIGGQTTLRLSRLSPAVTSGKLKIASNGVVRSSPAFSGGVIYFGSDDGHLYALE